jgi:hypothetical protein
MRWHPASGLGIVALANGTYAPMSTVATAALGDLVSQLDAPLRSTPVALPMLEAAEAAVTSWLEGDDPEGDSAATIRALCADNVEIDVPWAERIAVWHAFRRSHGAVVTVPDTAVRASPGSVSWEMSGKDPKNRLRVTVLMAPHDTRLVQAIGIKAIDPAEPAPRAATDWT